MVIKITYPYKDKLNSLEIREIYIQTDDEELIHQLKTTINPIDIGIILTENHNKFKKIEKTTPDEVINIEEVLVNPNLNVNLELL